ncbi:MAG: hypothetical protein CSA26_13130, partial [Desulfobacterales bacterium]
DDDPLWPIFDDLTMEDLRANEREKQEIDALEGNPKDYALWLTKSLDRTWKVNEIRLKNLNMFREKVEDLADYYTKENQFLQDIEQTGGKEQENHILELCSLYHDTGNLRLLWNLLDKYGYTGKSHGNTPPMADFYQGLCALERFEYEKADQYFSLARDKDEQLAESIEKERKKLGDFYYRQAMTKMPMHSMGQPGQKIPVHIRVKGLACCPGHSGLCQEFRDIAQKDQQEISSLLNEPAQEPSAALSRIQTIANAWITLLEAEDPVRKCIPKEIVSDFYRTGIKVLLDQGQTEQARDMVLKALDVFPQDPHLYISAADTSFALEDFDNGVGYLARAVELDTSLGVYWKNIGDNLKTGYCRLLYAT